MAVFPPASALMTAVPSAFAVTLPADTLATSVLVLDQTMFPVYGSGSVVAVSVYVCPTFNERLFRMVSSFNLLSGNTVTVIESEICMLSGKDAVIVAVPSAIAVTAPSVTVATAGLLVVQIKLDAVACSGVYFGVKAAVCPDSIVKSSFKDMF